MLAVWNRLGVPRILANEKDGRLPTLRLGCDCQLAVGQGLPCEGQLAVSRCVGGVISFHSYNRHFFSHKLLELDIPPPVFRSNQSVVLNVDAVINHWEKEAAPSKIPDAMAPQLAEVVLPEEVDDEVIHLFAGMAPRLTSLQANTVSLCSCASSAPLSPSTRVVACRRKHQ
jgi:hypothetical protein